MNTALFTRPRHPKIYAFTTPQYKFVDWTGKKSGAGLLKIGYTERDVIDRVREQFSSVSPEKQPFEILYTESAVREDNSVFRDSDVHKLLKSKGFRQVKNEWFECAVDDLKQVVSEIKRGEIFETRGRHKTYKMRPEQEQAVLAASEYFSSVSNDDSEVAPHFLWNAKMRFGKTFATYQLARKMKWNRILVLTYKPVVEEAWKDELLTHVDFDRWQFIGHDGDYKEIDESRPLVWFASFQDILGHTREGRIKPRFEVAHLIEWDCVVLDEYHYGAWRDSAKELYDAESKDEFKRSIGQEFDQETFPLKVKNYLYLSGTPFRVLASGEFLENQIYNWSYADEQRAKLAWDESSDSFNPYSELPTMTLLTYEIPEEIRNIALQGVQTEFDLNEFFHAKYNTETQRNEFKYENEVQRWLDLIRGSYIGKDETTVGLPGDPPLPFKDVYLKSNLLHTFWFLPSVASCYAMADLMSKSINSFFHEYSVIVAAGKNAGIGVNALQPVRTAIGEGLKSKTITLSCGKLTTGVTVPQWTGIFILRNTTSPETYFQAAFRVQSPWYANNLTSAVPDDKTIHKSQCFVFDFAPSRALTLIAEYHSKFDRHSEVQLIEKRTDEFLEFLPVLCYDGFGMRSLDTDSLLDYMVTGTSATMIAKRWQSNRLLNMGDAMLSNVLDNQGILDILEKITAFRNLNKDITRVISTEKSLKKTKRKHGKLSTERERKQDRENQKFKQKLRQKLLKFLTRIPIFMYLTDNREISLKEVILNVEPKLFEEVCGITVDDFETLCNAGIFNNREMNSSIFAFKRFEETSLQYASADKTLHQTVGGFDTIVSRDEFEAETDND